MRTLAWLREETWAACVDAVPAGAEVTLLHVASAEIEHAAREARRALLGRPLPSPDRGPELETLSEQASAALLGRAAARLGRPAGRMARRGRLEREVVAVAGGFDLLVAVRDGDRGRPGPRSLGPPTRFVVDHAPCAVLLVWP